MFIYIYICLPCTDTVVCLHICIYVSWYVSTYNFTICTERLKKDNFSWWHCKHINKCFSWKGNPRKACLNFTISMLVLLDFHFQQFVCIHMHMHAYMVKPNTWRVSVSCSEHFISVYVGYYQPEPFILTGIMCLNIPMNTVPDRGTEVLQRKASTSQKQAGMR